MTTSKAWLALSTAASVGVGFLGGVMFRRRAAARECMAAAIGQLYEVDTEAYADGGLVDFLMHRADSSDLLKGGRWEKCSKYQTW